MDGDLNFPAGQGPKAYYKAPMLAGIVIGAVEAQKINSAVYFAAAAVLIFMAAKDVEVKAAKAEKGTKKEKASPAASPKS